MRKLLLLAALSLAMFSCATTAIVSGQVQECSVWSYNIRYLNDADSLNGNGWSSRLPWICSLVNWGAPDILGCQEVTWTQLENMADNLPQYAWIGEGRDGGKEGEASPLFYRTDRLTLEESGTFWLSETPETVSRGWDAALNRVCTWGHFRYINSGASVWVFNLHNDHFGKKAPLESAKLVLEKIAGLCKDGDSVVVTGDFNQDQDSEMYRLYTSSLSDAYSSAQVRYSPDGTFNKFGAMVPNPKRIDHIFVSPFVKVLSYGVLTETYRDSSGAIRYPSDHYPVTVRIVLTQ